MQQYRPDRFAGANRYSAGSIKLGSLLTALLLLMSIVSHVPVIAGETAEIAEPKEYHSPQTDYFFPLSGFPDCDFKESRVSRTSYKGVPAIKYSEYLEGSLYLTGYEILQDAQVDAVEMHRLLQHEFSDKYGEPTVQSGQQLYPDPDNKLTIWLNMNSHTRVFLYLNTNGNAPKCYVAFVNYK